MLRSDTYKYIEPIYIIYKGKNKEISSIYRSITQT